MSDVAVIGGGLAGLAAARTLRRAGYRCTVFEAADSVGGRIRSEKFDDITVDNGLQLMNAWYPAVKELLQPGEYAALNLKPFRPAFQTLTDKGLAMFCDPIRAPHLIPPFMRSKFGSALSFRDMFGMRKWMTSEIKHRSSLEMRKIRPSRVARDVSVSESLDDFGINRQMRKLVLDPLIEAFLFDPHGESSAIFAKWMLASLLRGTLAVPDNGMGELSATIGRIPGARIELNSEVTDVKDSTDGVDIHVGGSGLTERFPYAIVAVDPAVESRFTSLPQPSLNDVATWWFVSDDPMSDNPMIVVDGACRTPISAATELTAAAPSYAPERHLVAANVVAKKEAELPSDEDMKGHLGTLFGVDSSGWELVTRQFIADAIPVIPPQRRTPAGKLLHAGEFIGERTVVAGSQHATPTIDGALRSGQQAAKAIIKRLENAE